jgi:hypothetical protein
VYHPLREQAGEGLHDRPHIERVFERVPVRHLHQVVGDVGAKQVDRPSILDLTVVHELKELISSCSHCLGSVPGDPPRLSGKYLAGGLQLGFDVGQIERVRRQPGQVPQQPVRSR